MTPPDEPPSNPYDPNWPKPEQQPYGQPGSQPWGQDPAAQDPAAQDPAAQDPAAQDPAGPPPAGQAPYPPYGQAPSGQAPPYGQVPYGQPPSGQAPPYGQVPYGQPPSGQVPYGQVPYGQAPYGAPAFGAPGAMPHPSATTALILGLISLGGIVFCAGITLPLAPFAWVIGGRAVKEIDANPGRFGGRDQAQAGRIMGMIGTGLLVIGVLALIAFVVLAVVVSDSGSMTYDPTNGYTSDPAF